MSEAKGIKNAICGKMQIVNGHLGLEAVCNQDTFRLIDGERRVSQIIIWFLLHVYCNDSDRAQCGTLRNAAALLAIV